MSDRKHTFLVLNGPAGPSLYLDNYRVAGPKPWGGGTILHTFHTTNANLIALAALPSEDAAPLREALEAIRDTTLDQPAAVNVPDEDWYRRLLLDAMGAARRALTPTDDRA